MLQSKRGFQASYYNMVLVNDLQREQLIDLPDEVLRTSVDEYRDLLYNTRNKAVERLHPVTLEEEVPVDVEIAAVVLGHLSTKSLLDPVLVEVFSDPSKVGVAQVARVFTLLLDIVDVQASLLVRTNHSIVTVDGSGDTAPDTLTVVAALDEAQAAGESVVHGLALVRAENGGITTFTASHWPVLGVLGKTIGETVANEDGLEVDVPVLVGKNFGGEYRDVMSSVRLSSNVEGLLSVLRELVEEKSHQSVHVLASSDSVADLATRVRVTNVDGLVQEDDGSVGIPGVWVVVEANLLVH